MIGWIKLHRKFLEWEWFKIPDMVMFFVFLLLNANIKDKKWHGMEIKRGQYLTSLNSLEKNTGLSRQKIRTCLRRLEKTREINTQPNTRHTVITICNYDDYQTIGSGANTPTNTPLTHEQHTTNTNIRIKELKEGKNKEIDFNFSFSEFSEIWFDWCEYKKKNHGFKYKEPKSERIAIKKLLKISKSRMSVVREIIEMSITGGWKGFYEIKEDKKTSLDEDMKHVPTDFKM